MLNQLSMPSRLIEAWLLQPCTFKVDYTLENVPGREFGSVFLTDKNENLAVAVVSSGWSKVSILTCFQTYIGSAAALAHVASPCAEHLCTYMSLAYSAAAITKYMGLVNSLYQIPDKLKQQ